MFLIKKIHDQREADFFLNTLISHYIKNLNLYRYIELEPFDVMLGTKNCIIIEDDLMIGTVRIIFGKEFPHSSKYTIPEKYLKKEIAELSRLILNKTANKILKFIDILKLLYKIGIENGIEVLVIEALNKKIGEKIHTLLPNSSVFFGKGFRVYGYAKKHQYVYPLIIDLEEIKEEKIYKKITG